MKTTRTITKIKISKDSNIAKILNGKTRGFQNWYVKKILQNAHSYEII